MFYDNFRVEQIKSKARQKLAGKDEELLNQLHGWIYAVFKRWKIEHGNRNPQTRGGGLLVIVKPIPFNKAKPWECADLFRPSSLSLADKLHAENYAPFMEITARVDIRTVLALLIVNAEESTDPEDLRDAYERIEKLDIAEKAFDASFEFARPALEAQANAKIILAKGRSQGVEARKKIAKENKDKLLTAISGLFDAPEKPGWNWTNNEITAFLKYKVPYAESTILQTVKREAARYRKDKKEEQASKYPNR